MEIMLATIQPNSQIIFCLSRSRRSS